MGFLESVAETILPFCFVTWKETSTKFWCEDFCMKYYYVATHRQTFHLWWLCNSGCLNWTTVHFYLLSNLEMFVFNASRGYKSINTLLSSLAIASESCFFFFLKKKTFHLSSWAPQTAAITFSVRGCARLLDESETPSKCFYFLIQSWFFVARKILPGNCYPIRNRLHFSPASIT